MSSVPKQLEELRLSVAALRDRIVQLERENAAWREAFSRGNLPSPKTIVSQTNQ